MVRPARLIFVNIMLRTSEESKRRLKTRQKSGLLRILEGAQLLSDSDNKINTKCNKSGLHLTVKQLKGPHGILHHRGQRQISGHCMAEAMKNCYI